MNTILKKENIFLFIIVLWVFLVFEGHRIIPGSKWLIEAIPFWLVILNIMILLTIVILMVNIKNFSSIGFIIITIALTISLILFGIGVERYPINSIPAIIVIILVSIFIKIRRRKLNQKVENREGHKKETEDVPIKGRNKEGRG